MFTFFQLFVYHNYDYLGSGRASLDFGNCWNRGQVSAYLNDEKIATAGESTEVTVDFAFHEGFVLKIVEHATSIIQFNGFSVTECSGRKKYSIERISFISEFSCHSFISFSSSNFSRRLPAYCWIQRWLCWKWYQRRRKYSKTFDHILSLWLWCWMCQRTKLCWIFLEWFAQNWIWRKLLDEIFHAWRCQDGYGTCCFRIQTGS